MELYEEVVLDRKGDVIEGAQVRVLDLDGSISRIFNSDGAEVANPLMTGPLGEFSFQAANGKYRLQIYVTGVLYRTVGPVLLYDPAGANFSAIVDFDGAGVSDGAVIVFAGRSAANDGGGGAFTYSKTSAQPADGGTVFAPAGGGRLFRQGWTVLGFCGETNLLWWGAAGGFVGDDTAAIQAAMNSSAALKATLRVPNRIYKLVPATAVVDEAGATTVALVMCSGLRIMADKGATFKIADNVSTDAAPKSMRGLFSNQMLNRIKIHGLIIDMNGQNNKISPNRATFAFNRWTQAHICFSGTPGGVAAGANDVVIEDCEFINGPGVSCIVMAQSNMLGVALGSGWALLRNRFYNNGLDTDDHSSVFGWANDVRVLDNDFINPAPFNVATHTGGLVAYEVHGSRTKFCGNKVENYTQALWIGSNLSDTVRDVLVTGNTARISVTFLDFYSANLSSGPTSESSIEHVTVAHNTIEITNDAVAEQVKAFFKIAARKQPSIVRISDNVCRSYDTTKANVLVLMIVSPNQLLKANQISIVNNTGAGIVAGLITYFSGNGATAATQNVGSVHFGNNDLGTLVPSPGGLYPNSDVVLYGFTTGRIEGLRVYGLQAPIVPISVDGWAGGRATVYGKAIVPIAVTWNSLSALGNGSFSSKISIDSDAGHASINVQLNCGSTTFFTGENLYPRFAGMVADAPGTVSGVINYPSSAAVVAGRIDNTGSWATMYSNSGLVTSTSPAAFVGESGITVSGVFPLKSVDI